MSDDLSIPNPAYRSSRAGRYGSGQLRAQQTMDPDTRRLMLFALGLGAILSILIATSAIMGHRRTADVPVIAADPRPVRIKPDNPGGMKIDGADNDLFSGDADNKTALLAATAEAPDTVALTGTGTGTGTGTDVGTATGSQARTRAQSVEQPPLLTALTPTDSAPAKPASLTIPPPPAKPATVKPAATPTPSVTPKLPAPAAPKPSAPAASKPSAAAPETHAAAAPRQAVVQLAALTSEEAARNEWQQLTRRMPDLLAGHPPSYSRVDRDGHTFWRLRTTGFADVAGARGFCDHVRAKGGGCSLADF